MAQRENMILWFTGILTNNKARVFVIIEDR